MVPFLWKILMKFLKVHMQYYSAHGVSPEVRKRAEKRKLQVLDATCPLVTKVHGEAQRYAQKEHTIILIGHHNHVEVKGTVGEAPEHIIVVGTVEEVSDLEDSRMRKRLVISLKPLYLWMILQKLSLRLKSASRK